MATEYGFDPESIMDWDAPTFAAVMQVHVQRVERSQSQSDREG